VGPLNNRKRKQIILACKYDTRYQADVDPALSTTASCIPAQQTYRYLLVETLLRTIVLLYAV
jgi:hypothetical protein